MTEISNTSQLGDQILLEIFPAPTRTTLFPEQVITIGTVNKQFELVLVRHEMLARTQKAEVTEVAADGLSFKVLDTNVAPQLTDIGHVRLPCDQAVQMSINILRHARDGFGVDLKPHLAELTKSTRRAK
jgi:hypothetical protein